MGILVNCATGRRVFLRAEHVFGRSRMADTLLDHPGASQLHASIRWTGQAWELRDHSSNGTLLNTHPLPPHRPVALEAGAVLEFGRGGTAWKVESVAEPSSLLWPLHEDGPVISLQADNALPSEAQPELRVHATASGQWLCSARGESRLLQDGDEVDIGGKRWCFVSGTAVQATLGVIAAYDFSAGQPLLNFSVSLDEEHVSLRISGDHAPIDLGERTHHYCLLTLARLRLGAAQRSIDSDAQGWVDLERLAKMLGTDPSHLNIQIFRARKQIAQALPAGRVLPDVVERRRGAVRFGNLGARIMRGSTLEGILRPTAAGAPAQDSLAA